MAVLRKRGTIKMGQKPKEQRCSVRDTVRRSRRTQSGVRACHSSLGGEGGARRNEGSNDKAEKVAQSNAKMATRRPPSREGCCILTAASCGIEPNLHGNELQDGLVKRCSALCSPFEAERYRAREVSLQRAPFANLLHLFFLSSVLRAPLVACRAIAST